MWQDQITPDNVAALADQLEAEGGLAYARQKAAEFTSAATDTSLSATPHSPAGDVLSELITFLIEREASIPPITQQRRIPGCRVSSPSPLDAAFQIALPPIPAAQTPAAGLISSP